MASVAEQVTCRFGDCNDLAPFQIRAKSPNSGDKDVVIPVCKEHGEEVLTKTQVDKTHHVDIKYEGGSIQFTDVPGQMIVKSGLPRISLTPT